MNNHQFLPNKNIPEKILITGASGGIGRAISKEIGKSCSILLLHGRNIEELNLLHNELTDLYPHLKCIKVNGDLKKETCIQEIIECATEHEINGFIHAAGVNDLFLTNSNPFEYMTKTKEMMNVNLMAGIEISTRLLPQLIHESFAKIVFIGSIFSYIGYPGQTSYCMTKFALRGFTESLRRELMNTNITIQFFAPRATETNMNLGKMKQLQESLSMKTDKPEIIAKQFYQFIQTKQLEKRIGFFENLASYVNAWFPSICDKAISKELDVIEKTCN